MNLALIFQLFQLLGRLFGKMWRQILRIDLVQAGVETQSALLQSSHLLEAQSHIVHSDLDQKPIFGILLEL